MRSLGRWTAGRLDGWLGWLGWLVGWLGSCEVKQVHHIVRFMVNTGFLLEMFLSDFFF